MVKADVKRDYYADLDLPANADAEEIKKQFRLLAKQYHPDRNPGHEVDVVPKFQAVQAAHEILSDPVEKAKYDAGRAKLAARNFGNPSAGYQHVDPYGSARANPSKPTPQFPFPPPPKPTQKRTPFAPSNQKPQASAADKFNAFTRGAPSWDRAKFDEARAEAARAFPNMRHGQVPPQMPPRATRQAPTAPKPSPSSEMPHVPNVPPTGFPGLSRTTSARKQGYTPKSHGMDEPQAPRSAYSYVQGDRRQQAPQNPHVYVPEGQTMRAPPVSRARPAVSPLRHTRSSDYDMRADQTPGSRPPSRYAAAGGEKTDLHGEGMHRSASVRNSPVDPQWEERGAFGRPPAGFQSIPRSHSTSPPGMRKAGAFADFSESSSDDEVLDMNNRPKAVPRSRPRPKAGHSYHTSVDNNPGLTGQFPSTNYTKIVEDGQYQYPAPETREPTRKPFPDVSAPGAETAGQPHVSPDNSQTGGHSDRPKYAPFTQNSFPRSQSMGNGGAARGTSFNGFPLWAVPSSVLPQTTPPRGRKQESKLFPSTRGQSNPLDSAPPDLPPLRRNGANPTVNSDPDQPNAPFRFSAAEWTNKVTADHIFRASDPQVRKSPSKLNRTGSKPTARGAGQSRDGSSAETLAGQNTNPGEDSSSKSDAFLKGKLPDDWAAHVKATTNSSQPKPPNPRQSPVSEGTNDSSDRYVVVEEDVMDVDAPPSANGNQVPASNGVKHPTTETSRSLPKRRSTNGVDLKEFAQQAPFAPAASGLKGMDDLATHLPFDSRAEIEVDAGRKNASRLRALNLPRPPKVVIPPPEDRLDTATFLQYVDSMSAYMREWNTFNGKMIEHFRSRQDRMSSTMSPNWISQLGNGPDADILEENGVQKAGYAAYMQWLKDDEQCRTWWDHAQETHMQCIEDLGKTREAAKKKLRST